MVGGRKAFEAPLAAHAGWGLPGCAQAALPAAAENDWAVAGPSDRDADAAVLLQEAARRAAAGVSCGGKKHQENIGSAEGDQVETTALLSAAHFQSGDRMKRRFNNT